MKRLERTGSIAFLTITISFVFHLLGMSFNDWIENNCRNCNESEVLSTWHTSLRNRCYLASFEALFVSSNSSSNSFSGNSFLAEICIPNQILMAKDPIYAYDCLLSSINNTHTICATQNYNKNICKCDYISRTKVVLSMTILTVLSLGLMLFISHLISFTKLDYFLRWLFPLCFILLIFSIICIIVTLAVFSIKRNADINELIFSSSLISTAFQNGTLANDWKEYLKTQNNYNYQIKVGWSYGMEVLALQFALVTLILYILMFMAKTRPEPED